MRNLNYSIVVFATILFSLTRYTSAAQDYSITESVVSACSGRLLDSGGIDAQYGAGENYFTTIVSGVPGGVVGVRLVSSQIADGDTLRILDGTTLSSPVIAIITGNQLIGHSYVALNSNGALTVRFTSDFANTVGNFILELNCNTCAGVLPRITNSNEILRVCVGEPLSFLAAGSSVPSGNNVSAYNWDFDDGSPIISASEISHAFHDPGLYYVSMNLIDNLGCQAPFPAYQRVEVVSTPELILTSSADSVCVGEEVEFQLHFSPQNFMQGLTSNGGHIPDNTAPGLLDTLMVVADPTLFINSTSDISYVSIDIEHSYSGDIIIELICPNGQVVSLYGNQSLGSFWLGRPIDDLVETSIGEGDTYYWSPSVTSPQWGTETADYHQTVTNATNGTGTQLIPGYYAITGDWNTLMGCPIAGNWQLHVQDLVGADDGNVLSWSIALGAAFDAGLNGGFTMDTNPVCATVEWIGPAELTGNSDCTTFTMNPNVGGLQYYSVSANSNYGCGSSTGAFIYVSNPIDASVTFTDILGETGGDATLNMESPDAIASIVWSSGSTDVTSVSGLEAGSYYVELTDTLGCSKRYYFLVEDVTGVSELGLTNMTVRFNEHSQELMVSGLPLGTNVLLKVYDIQGKLCDEFYTQGNATATRSMTNFAPGVFVVKSLLPKEERATRFVKP
jgi:subtilisin-like proprotein convertase family protein